MRITIVTLGSLGDVQPFVALGRGLQATGHTVRLAAHDEFAPLIRRHGLEFAPIAGNPQAVLESEAGLAWLETEDHPIRYIRAAMRVFGPLVDAVLESSWQACRDAELILDSTPVLAGLQSAERLGVPSAYTMVVPVEPSRAYPHPLVPLPGWCRGVAPLNLLTHTAVGQALWQATRPLINRWRASLGLAPIGLRGLTAYRRRRAIPTLLGYSGRVLPRPADWPDDIHLTGYWMAEPARTWEPPSDLRAFFEAGPRPVSIGFGSMKVRDPRAVTDVLLEALYRTGQRAVVLGGWAGLARGALPLTVFALHAPVPHEWLFPRVAAAIHHGGAGTTAAALRAGVPSIVTPFFGDQPLWGARVAALGAGPTPIPFRRLSAGALAEAIDRAVTDSTMQARAARLGAQLRAEDGVACAVDLLHQCLGLVPTAARLAQAG